MLHKRRDHITNNIPYLCLLKQRKGEGRERTQGNETDHNVPKRLLRETRVHRAAEVGVCKLMPFFACLWIREFVTKTITKGGGDK